MKPSKEILEACLVFWISRCRGRASSKKLACGNLCTKDAINQCGKAEKTIRTLIEKVDEWQKKAEIFHLGYLSIYDQSLQAKFIREIRDFGKEEE